MLTVKEVADLQGCNERSVQRLISQGKLQFQTIMNSQNRKKYLVPISALDIQLQQKYYNQTKSSFITPILPQNKGKPLDCFTTAERDEIAFWINLINQWQSFRNHPKVKSKVKADDDFIAYCRVQYPDADFSTDTLYRKWKAVRENNTEALIDKRGKWKKGKSTIDDNLWQIFLYYYLDEAQHPIKRCYEYTKMYAKEECPHLLSDIPTYVTFYRRVQSDISEAVEILGREGEKAFRDRCAPYIKRVYDDMVSNEWWVADNHTFDIMTLGENEKPHRLYLTAFFDARSGIFTGCHVTNNPSSQATLIALRKGILKYGIPENIYVDNGREFLTFDIGGLGHRKKKIKNGEERFEPPPIFERLGIKMTNAIVGNAKAKIIERRFRDVKDHLSRLFETYTGGNVLERPEKLKTVMKNGEIPLDSRLTEIVEELLEWHFNQQPYGGAVGKDKGKPRAQVYNENLHSKRVASAEDLNLMLMRSTRPQKVTRRGVHLDIAGQSFDYWNDDMLMALLGQTVYFRYDPDDLSEVRIYDLEDRFIMTVPADNQAIQKYGAGKDDVKQALSKVRKFEKLTKEALKANTYPAFGRKTALELVLADAEESKMAKIIPPANPAVLSIHRANEEPLYKEAVGFANLDTMNKNAMKRGGSLDDKNI